MQAAAITNSIGPRPGVLPVPDAPSIDIPNELPEGPRGLPTIDVVGQGIRDLLEGILGLAPRLDHETGSVPRGPLPLPMPHGDLMIRSDAFLA